MLFPTVLLISPTVAAQSAIPWVLLALSNIIWLIDSYVRSDAPWITVSVTLLSWDLIAICDRAGFVAIDTASMITLINHYIL